MNYRSPDEKAIRLSANQAISLKPTDRLKA